MYEKDNVARDRDGNDVAIIGAKKERCRLVDAPPAWPDGLKPMPAAKVKDHVLKNAGARPWDRDEIDKRIVQGVIDG